MNERPYDLVLYGASGFVGRQTVAHLARHGDGVRWALAGRSREKLEAARAAAGEGAVNAGVIVADAGDAAALDALASQAKVVLSTAGPFALYGSELVAACVRHGTHYVDITGETPWVRDLIQRHDADARASGTRIVPCCGFDSVPSDLGTWVLAHEIRERFGEPCREVTSAFSLRGGFNGGTIASLLNVMAEGESEAFANPFLLNPAGTAPADTAPHRDPAGPHRDGDHRAWLGPFLMGPINTRVVRRTVALAAERGDTAFAGDFRYGEYMRLGRGARAGAMAWIMSAGMAATKFALKFDAGRRLAARWSPAPGEGPTEAQMDRGGFRCELVGRSASGLVLRARVSAKGDPGNRATTVFVCESALALVRNLDVLPPGGGVMTPATALGDVLVRRLHAAGVTLEVLPA